MSRSDIITGIEDVLASVATIERSDATPQQEFQALGIDSMTMLEVIAAVEERFEMLIPDDEWPRFRTVDDLGAYIEGAQAVS